MKKYGVYSAYSGTKMGALLIREYSELKDAVKEAYRLSRCRYHYRAQRADTFIVASNTGITLNLTVGKEYVRYFVERYIIFDDTVGFLEIYGGQTGVKRTFMVKAGII
jgi:hypothetical protein